MARNKNSRIQEDEHKVSHLISDNSESFHEVSFDVLENAVDIKNKKHGYKTKNFRSRAIISSDEVLPEKRRIFKRKNRDNKDSKTGKLAIVVLILILLFGVLASVLSYLYNNGYFSKPDESNELKLVIYQISEYDKYLFQLNEFLETPISENSISNSGIDKQEFDEVKNNLSDLANEIDEIGKTIDVNSEEYLYVGYAKQTIESRIMMIDAGLKIYDKAKSSVDVINKTESFWQNIAKADVCLKESDNLVASNDLENFSLAKKKSEEALNLLNTAKPQIDELNKMTDAFDFSTYSQYIDVRTESAKLSIDACQALIDLDMAKIASTNIAYIEKSNQASELAKSISTTPVQLIRANYDINIRPIIDEFKAARKNAADNDYALRNYLYS